MTGPASHKVRVPGSKSALYPVDRDHILLHTGCGMGECIRIGSENGGRETSWKAVIGTQVRKNGGLHQGNGSGVGERYYRDLGSQINRIGID